MGQASQANGPRVAPAGDNKSSRAGKGDAKRGCGRAGEAAARRSSAADADKWTIIAKASDAAGIVQAAAAVAIVTLMRAYPLQIQASRRKSIGQV